MQLILPIAVDRRLRWPPGTAESLARNSVVEHVRLIDGAIRFTEEHICQIARIVPASCSYMRITGDVQEVARS